MSATSAPGPNPAEGGDATAENACCVCFRDVGIYSIGTCDHPVCFECSTRMRVLCGQNECPFCRQNVAKVSSEEDWHCPRMTQSPAYEHNQYNSPTDIIS